ncbi:MAG: biopolymer transporter ExbD [Methylicorpusculum sp.]|uniref:ExbD/TolR family protein n=1 Tax=Methylicorpusculum sp. TaxID=2713644 RepID=UPI00271C4CB5|nr:biopolymer transporter ExbD [Methylicorpusculum sp.]MDO8845932.1 biopolymer transporter ExbD [Methylicorpusculum sp.]MDO8938280.1 biopolymer transporter ExbD [Methylicorpusculum sp.]MDP2202130.1 biopolymer transporter ExbD [Methylicorpusculum sp.]
MNFHRKKREKLEISITPMIDVVFLLLIFFMVTTTFNKETALNIKLPQAEGEEPEQQPKVINLTIDAQGTYYLSGDDGLPRELVNQKKETLKGELQKLAVVSPNLPFIINADAKTPHEAVIRALDIAGQVGFKRITFAAIRTQNP